MNELQGKRLLFLGAVRPLCEAVEIAKSMGIYTIVTDYLPNSPAKKHADKACMVSTIDVDAVVNLCKEEKVDGLFTAYTDSMLPYARKICDRLGFPFYASQEQIDLSLNKELFKETCRKYGVPVPIDYKIDVVDGRINTEGIEFPVIVKPIDSSGGRGVRICNNHEEFSKAYEYALSISPGKKVLVEEYVIGDEVTATYTMKNGEISLSCFKDKIISLDHEGITSQSDILIMPSKHLKRYFDEANEKVIDMLKGINATDGSVFFQGIMSEKGIKFFELGYRVNGASDYRHIAAENKINYMKMMLSHAVTGQMLGYELSQDNPFFGQYVLTYNLWAHGGIIGSICGKEQIEDIDNIVICEYLHNEGDEIVDNNTLAQRVFRAVIKDRNVEKIKETIKRIQEAVKVTDINGNNMLYKPFDTEKMNEYKDLI